MWFSIAVCLKELLWCFILRPLGEGEAAEVVMSSGLEGDQLSISLTWGMGSNYHVFDYFIPLFVFVFIFVFDLASYFLFYSLAILSANGVPSSTLSMSLVIMFLIFVVLGSV